ncbi:hypothetical protein E5288_WYG001148 [Bos mutus]|uniref:inositol-polyphosphate 5-phosphatase n=1 Tax=Bos mutus TaxID=72004 RepID=A0A6B0S308_9CETA|nr:hypothetical protein [Bos mutus]
MILRGADWALDATAEVFPGCRVGLGSPESPAWATGREEPLKPELPALGSFYFLHESLKNIYQFDFKAKKYKKVTGKEIYSDTLESTPMLEKEKFPQDYFPECKWSRKGFLRTRWCLADCAFDLVNIHLFHDASNLVAWETSPSVYSGIRHKALGYVLDRISDQRFQKASYFVFGDFNFRLDSKSVVEAGAAGQERHSNHVCPEVPAKDGFAWRHLLGAASRPLQRHLGALSSGAPSHFVNYGAPGTPQLPLALAGSRPAGPPPVYGQSKQTWATRNPGGPWREGRDQSHLPSPVHSTASTESGGAAALPPELMPSTLCTKATMQTVRAADTNEVVKLIFRESDNDRKVMLQLEKKLFDYFNQEVFRDDNGTALLEFDKELSVFKDRLYELDISFPPSYPYSEDCSQGRQYMNTRCPAWCDRVLMSPSAKELVLRSESEEKVVTYDHIGPSVCMGDHKPVFLAFRIAPGADLEVLEIILLTGVVPAVLLVFRALVCRVLPRFSPVVPPRSSPLSSGLLFCLFSLPLARTQHGDLRGPVSSVHFFPVFPVYMIPFINSNIKGPHPGS